MSLAPIRILTAVLAATLAGTLAAGETRPNIVMITCDNLGYGDVGSYGNPHMRTPFMDRLSRQGVRLTDFYTSSPTCTVSRASLLTGRYPLRHKLVIQLPGIAGNYGVGLRHSEKLLPQYLKDAGYVTGAFGKWNIGFAPGSRPTERGFDEFLGNASGAIDYYHHLYQGKHDLYRGVEEAHLQGRYATDLYADETIDFITRHQDRPFFVYLPFNAPHFTVPGNRPEGAPPEAWQAPDEIFELYGYDPSTQDERQRYRAVVTAMDYALGRVIDHIDNLGLTDRTLLMFHSDNGAFMLPGRGLEVASNAPLRQGGVTVWEGGIRVPGWVRWPGVFPAGSVCSEPLIAMDLFALALSAAGVPLPGDRVIDGKDPTETLAGRAPSPHKALFWHYRDNRADGRAVRRGQYKLIQADKGQEWQLFDLINDPGETRNLASEKPALAASLKQEYLLWEESASE